MRKNFKPLWGLLSLLLSLGSAWAQTAPDLFHVGVGTHLYLRCNSTSWDVSELSRLKPGTPDFLRELGFDVKESWMVEEGDDCVITETPELNAWGGWQKYYGGQLALLRVPESTRLRLPIDSQESVYFKLRFPSLGRYRLTLNTRDGYFSIRKDAEPGPGDVVWTLPGNMLADRFDNLFLSNYYPQNSLLLVDRSSGLPRWTYKAETYISFYGNCSTADTAFITLTGRVVALSLKTGREIWSTDLNGSLQGSYAYLTCFANNNQIFLSYGSDRTTLVSLNKVTGRALWSWTAEAYAGIMGVDAARVFVNTYQETRSALKALNKSNGREIWQTEPGEGYYSITEDGDLFLVKGSVLAAIASETGREVWTHSGQPGDSIWLTFEHNGLYVHEKTRLTSVDKKSGRILWTYDYSSYAEQYPYAQILKAGVVMVRVNDYHANVSRQIALNSWTGQVLWEREESGTNSFLSEDNQSGTWLISGKTIRSMDPWTGNTRWSFTLQSEVPWENIMSVMEHDRSTVYVTYGYVGSKYPPMGVLALDARTGRLKWQTWMESSVYRVASDINNLILNAGYYGSIKALKK